MSISTHVLVSRNKILSQSLSFTVQLKLLRPCQAIQLTYYNIFLGRLSPIGSEPVPVPVTENCARGKMTVEIIL